MIQGTQTVWRVAARFGRSRSWVGWNEAHRRFSLGELRGKAHPVFAPGTTILPSAFWLAGTTGRAGQVRCVAAFSMYRTDGFRESRVERKRWQLDHSGVEVVRTLSEPVLHNCVRDVLPDSKGLRPARLGGGAKNHTGSSAKKRREGGRVTIEAGLDECDDRGDRVGLILTQKSPKKKAHLGRIVSWAIELH